MDTNQIIAILQANNTKSFKVVGDLLGCSRQYAKNLFTKFNITHFNSIAERLGITVDILKGFQEKSVSREEAAKQLGISSRRLKFYCSKLGVHLYSIREERENLAKQGKRRCFVCGTIKDLNSENFHKSKSDKHGFNSFCKECNRLMATKYYHEHKKK